MTVRKKAAESAAAEPAGKAAEDAAAAPAGKAAEDAAAAPVEKAVEAAEKAEDLFSAEQLLSGERFRNRRDLLTALLEPGRQYTLRDVEKMIGNYMKGQVK